VRTDQAEVVDHVHRRHREDPVHPADGCRLQERLLRFVPCNSASNTSGLYLGANGDSLWK
jgi:hypothetical protein